MERAKITRNLLVRWRAGAVPPGKVVVLLGPRRVGKTQLLQQYVAEQTASNPLVLNGEDEDHLQLLERRSRANYARLLKGHGLLVLDEGQYVPEVGAKLKLMVDNFPEKRFIVTGSSALELAGDVGEPLTGRRITQHLYPLALQELVPDESPLATQQLLEDRLVYGFYPELLHYPTPKEKAAYLRELVASYLFRDILKLENVRSPRKLTQLLQLLAWQIGKDVSHTELGNSLQLDNATVGRYLDLLEKAFVVRKLQGYSRNLRKEVTKSHRYYFLDNGVRNAVINDFRPPVLRQDMGQLWENFLVAERFKLDEYNAHDAHFYFWRTYDRQEIDLVEEANGELRALEAKYNPHKKTRPPGGWLRHYPEASYTVVTPENYLDHLLPPGLL